MKFPYKHKAENWFDYAPKKSQEFCKITTKITKNGYHGVFALENIPKGRIVGRTGGVVLSSIDDLPAKYDYPVLIDDGVFLGPEDYDELETLSCLNHSCAANVARIGGSILVAKKNIKKSQELTSKSSAEILLWNFYQNMVYGECRIASGLIKWKNSVVEELI